MYYELNRRINALTLDLALKGNERFLYQFDILVSTAKDIANQLANGDALSNTKLNSELSRLSTLTNSYKHKFSSLSPALLEELNTQHKSIDTEKIPDNFPFNQHINNILTKICKCCEKSMLDRERIESLDMSITDLSRVVTITDKYKNKLGSFSDDVLVKLDAQYIKSGMSLFSQTKYSTKYVLKTLNKISKYCDLAKLEKNKTSHYTNVECFLADEFQACGGIITIADNGTFANLLRIFRDECKIPSFPSYSVNAMEVSRIESHRKNGLHLRKLFSSKC
jgi:hypothetical protein